MKPVATVRDTLLSLRDLLVSVGPFALLALALLAAAYWWLDPNPPKRVVLATGPAQSAYDQIGQRYQRALAAHGIQVVLRPTDGSSANLALLREHKVDLGFVQGGSAEPQPEGEEGGLASLGSLFLEPVWVFYRAEVARRLPGKALTSPTQLTGLRVNVGTPGSGVPALVNRLLEANRMDPGALTLSRLDQTPATVAFLAGELDVIVFASAPESLLVQMLLMTPGVQLMDFAHSEAYARRMPFLSPVVLPRGVVDLARDQPPQDVRLVATTTSLLAQADTHPALVQLFTQAAREVHGSAGWFNRAGAFPTADHAEYPLAPEAERALRTGRPFLQRWLPFWIANLVERMWLALGIILAVLLPLSRVVPPLYAFRIRSRVFRWYGQLRDIEAQLAAPGADAAALIAELEALDTRVAGIQVPLAYTDELYALRQYIGAVRRRAAQPPAARALTGPAAAPTLATPANPT
ncbi:TAXI family TRAP transporter solute-binding subunit [Ramlibacter sp.]|uniref:TAXI family TRAP transporter solute-binding subunit n=1 Tax=Ramlibacter sp. TaxID=1917967 RepID=UPI0035B36B5C